MKACRITAPGNVETSDIPEPKPTSQETVVGVKRVGLCGTDLRAYTGENPNIEYPRIIGHEIGAVLSEQCVVDGRSYDSGTVVAVNPYSSCGSCPACRNGRSYACQFNQTLGNQRDGGAVERLAIKRNRLYPLPRLDVDAAACVEPLSVGFHAAARGAISEADSAVVLGAGMIGLGAVAGAVARGARVIAVDLDDRKLEIAQALGAQAVVNAANDDPHSAIMRLTNEEGASVVVEAIGSPATYRQAIDFVAFTGRVVFIGYAKEDVAFTTKFFVAKELDIRGSRNAADEDFQAVIEALGRGQIPVQEIITRRYPLNEASEAFRYWGADPNRVTKVVLEV
ncbi:MAG: zinc-binding alcohol dehydrogenase family protein [Spirochaetaceae bacterium]